MPINAGMGEPGSDSGYTEIAEHENTWDVARARDWDNLAANVPELLNVLGVSGRSPEEQRRALHEFTQTAPYVPCPFKDEVQQFLEGA
jgi:hypothetical protein